MQKSINKSPALDIEPVNQQQTQEQPRVITIDISIKGFLRLHRWESKSKLTGKYPPHIFKQIAVKEFAQRFPRTTFVETGTYKGRMIEAVSKIFSNIITIELAEKLYKRAKRIFANKSHITCIHGDSGKKLTEVIATLDGPAMFWLDGHHCGGLSAKGDFDTPIIAELKTIANHKYAKDNVILIDDACCFNGKKDYPTIKQMETMCRNLFPFAVFEVEKNLIRIHPQEKISQRPTVVVQAGVNGLFDILRLFASTLVGSTKVFKLPFKYPGEKVVDRFR
jgi:hypothetical protein